MANRELMTIEQHQAMARKLHRIRTELMDIQMTIVKHVSPVSKTAKQAARAVNQVDELRARLDDLYANHYGVEFSPQVYYPGDKATEDVI